MYMYSVINAPYGNIYVHVVTYNRFIHAGVVLNVCIVTGKSDTFPGICVVYDTGYATTNTACNFCIVVVIHPCDMLRGWY